VGGGSKTQTVAYKYLTGMHFILCLGPTDALTRIRIEDRIAWSGSIKDGRIVIHEPNLFGGTPREGGVSGYLDVASGISTQLQNDYLDAKIPNPLPAYRGLLGVICRHFYFGNNPYLKPWRFRVRRILSNSDGASWYPEKAAIIRKEGMTGSAIYIAMDYSGSMNDAPTSPTRWETQVDSIVSFLTGLKNNIQDDAKPNDVIIVLWSAIENDYIIRRNCTAANYDELIAWLEAQPNPNINNGTLFKFAFQRLETFFLGGIGAADIFARTGSAAWGEAFTTGGSGTKQRIIIFTTDGVPSSTPEQTVVDEALAELAKVAQAQVFVFNIELTQTQWSGQLDNTPDDGVPIVTSLDPDALVVALNNVFVEHADMNPAHIIREVLIATDTGGSGNAAEIGDSFTTAADTLFNESFGLSFLWKTPAEKSEFLDTLERHVDARVYVDRITGKWELKLIRDDYVFANLYVLDDSNIAKWSEIRIADPTELPNQVSIVHNNFETYQQSTVTVTNIARVQITGGIINEKIEYEGVWTRGLASRIALRDLRALSTPLLSGTLEVRYLPEALNRGSAFVLHSPSRGIYNRVCRIEELDEGDGRSNRIEVKFIEDKWSFDTEDIVIIDEDLDPADSTVPTAPLYRLVEEVPYYELVKVLGQTATDEQITNNPDIGYLMTTCEYVVDTMASAQVWIDAGGGYVEEGVTSPAPVAFLDEDIDYYATTVTFAITVDSRINDVEIGSLCRIGTEYMRVDALVVTGTTADITVGRGCLDTTPRAHTTGDPIIFWQDWAASTGTEYVDPESINVKLLPVSGQDVLPIDSATADNLVFSSRAVRPYPPGNLQVNSLYEGTYSQSSYTLNWVNRNRLTQTTTTIEDHADGNITPEVGTTYHVLIEGLDNVGAVTTTMVNTDVGAVQTYLFEPGGNIFDEVDVFAMADFFEGSAPAGTVAWRFSVSAVRDTYTSWQPAIVYAT